MENFKTIMNSCHAQIVEKKSKFIADIYPIENKEEAETILKQIRKKYIDARHHCFAYITFENEGIYERCSDDGEPSQTAGAPMLNLLKTNELCNVIVVVTRYFGGILLGTGGLVRAYSEATLQAIKKAHIVEKQLGKQLNITLEYSQIEAFRYYCRKHQIAIIAEKYEENVLFEIEITDKMLDVLNSNIDKLNFNMIKMEQIGKKYIAINVGI